jgi:hypothetical protein
MKHVRFVRLLPWLVIGLCPPLLGHCGGALEHGTETGNPPVVEQQKLHVVLHDDGVEVVGEAGAVSPGASVTVTNTRSADHADAIARADGSLSVSVPGTLADEYELTVASAGGSQTVRVTASASDAASSTTASADAHLSDAELASASCDALGATLEQRVSTAFASADSRCTTDEDCKYREWSVACYNDCGSSILPPDGFSRVAEQLDTSLQPLCTELGKRCSPVQNLHDCRSPDALPQCLEGSCRALDLSSYSCEDLSTAASARFDELLTGANRECTQDADCFLYEEPLSCAFRCPGQPTAVAASAVTAIEAYLAHVEGYCDAFRGRGNCSAPAPLPCPPPLLEPKAVCILPSLGVPGTPGQCSLASTQR